MLQRKTRHLRSRFAESLKDIEAAQRFRFACFHGGNSGLDADGFDALCRHVLIEDQETGALLCTFRLFELKDGAEIDQSYSAQFYDLTKLKARKSPLLEIGRFCISPEVSDPNILRMAWAEITRIVDAQSVELLFGCSSFHGTDASHHKEAFALLKERHLGPMHWMPEVKSPDVFEFARAPKLDEAIVKRGLKGLPPLLRSYLAMGGWVSDHAVVDPLMNTLHVFTGIEIANIPAVRKRLLRADTKSPGIGATTKANPVS